MSVFITLTDANISDPTFWGGLDVTVDSTIDASGISDNFQITMTGSSISFTDTATDTTTTYSNADLSSGSFSEFVEFMGNNADSDVSGGAGLNSTGYTGGTGNDTFTDDGTLGGGITGGAGDDVLIGGVANNNIVGGAGNDILRGGSGSNNILQGGAGNDILFADDGGGNLEGGDGDDIIYAGLETDFVQGGSGNDTLVVPEGSIVTPFSEGATGGNVSLPGGGSFVYLDIETITIACFTNGTHIRTPDGNIAIEKLCVGDLVDTLDNGPQPIRWIGQRTVPGKGKHAPICFQPNSVGNTDLMRLSPQHRVLISGWKCELLFDSPEVLCAAKHLCDGDQIYVTPCDEVTYLHLMFDRHEIIFAEDTPSESFFVGDHITSADTETHDELIGLFPELASAPQQAARPFIKSFEAALL